MSPPLYIHVGYPKTATTTFQAHVYPQHPELDYLGKFIPGFDYVAGLDRNALDALMTRPKAGYQVPESLVRWINQRRDACNRKAILLSSESFVHVTAADTAVLAERLRELCPAARIIITIREQVALLCSFYETHGCYGQYLFLMKEEFETIELPLGLDHWLRLQFRAPERNLPGLLQYDQNVGIFDQIFGRENVGIFLYEKLVADPDRYLSELCDFLGIATEPARALLAGRHENPGRRDQASTLGCIQPVYRSPAFEDPQWGSLDRGISDQRKQEIADWFRTGNQRLAATRGLPLSAYGYNC